MDEKTSHYSCKVHWTRRFISKRWRSCHYYHHWELSDDVFNTYHFLSITIHIYMMQTTITTTESRRHWQWWDEYNMYMYNMNTKSKREREKIEGKSKTLKFTLQTKQPKRNVYLLSNVQESRPQPLSLIDNTSHLEAKRSMRLMVCISGQEKKAKKKEREGERERQGIGTTTNYIIAWCTD